MKLLMGIGAILAGFSVVFLTYGLLFASSSSDFRRVNDSDKHGFTDLDTIKLDINGDDKIDTIQPRTSKREGWVWNGQFKRRPGIEHWIQFDLELASSAKPQTIFEYNYGNEAADYWVWALIPAGDMDRNGQLDLVFYTGDDTSDETIVLLQKGSNFTKCSTGTILGDYILDSNYDITTFPYYDVENQTAIPARIVGRWNGAKCRFEGTEIYWIRRERHAVRAEPRSTAKLIEWLVRNDAVINKAHQGKPITQGDWIKVEAAGGIGWVHKNGLAKTSRYVTP